MESDRQKTGLVKKSEGCRGDQGQIKKFFYLALPPDFIFTPSLRPSLTGKTAVLSAILAAELSKMAGYTQKVKKSELQNDAVCCC